MNCDPVIEYYELKRQEAAALELRARLAAREQLLAITAGVDVHEYIAKRQAELVALLAKIRDDMESANVRWNEGTLPFTWADRLAIAWRAMRGLFDRR